MNRAEKRRQQKLAEKAARNAKLVPSASSIPYQQTLSIQQSLDLAIQHHNAGRLSEAESIYRQILQTDPIQPIALNLLGMIAYQVGKNNTAVDLITKALTIKPNYAEAHFNLGNALHALGKLDKAIASCQKALAIKPDYVEAHNNLGDTLHQLGRLDEAVACYQSALAINPDSAETQNNLGVAFLDLGKLDEAVASLQKAIAIDPDFAEAYRNIVGIKKHFEYDEDIEAMEKVYAKSGISDEQRMHLAFGLGKSFEDIHQYEKAFNFFLTGNAIKYQTHELSIENVEMYFENFKKTFTKDFFNKHHGAGSPDKTPIFVLGMPRSGTTLVEQILASHTKVHGGGELNYLKRIATSHFNKNGNIQFPESVNQARISDFSSAADQYLGMIRAHADNAEFITDKMPENFRYIGMIKLMFPNAKIIHCRRDPLDTCLSIFKTFFTADGLYYAYDLNILGQYYNLYRDLMNHWRTVLPGFIYEIKYEDLVADQEMQTRSLLEYCGLEWDDACLEFYKTNRPVQTASNAQVRKPIYNDSIQLWKRYKNQLAPLLDIL